MKSLYLMAALVWVSLLHAQQADTVKMGQLPDVTVSANRIDIPFSETSRSIQVISRAQIEAAPVQSVAQLLQFVAGVDVRQRGAHGVQADVSIRGGTFDQTLVLINGIKMNDPQTGHHSMNLPVDLDQIERIEILKGPAARVFGQNAFAGAINIITRTPDEAYAQFQLLGGSNQLGGLRISVSLPKSNFKQYFSAGKDFSQGYRHNTDYDINQCFYQASFKYVNSELHLLAGYSEREFGANGFYASPAATEQYEEVQTSLVALELRHKKRGFQIKPRVYWRRNQDEYIFVRRNPSIYRNLHIGNTVGFEVNSSYKSRTGTSGFGIDLQQVGLRSNILGNHERQVATTFLEHRFSWGRLDVTPGILFNYFSDFGANLLPGIDAGLRLSDAWALYGNAGYTYRVPTFTDLYYEDPNNLGNPDLVAESAFSYELGLRYQHQGLRVQGSAFQRDGRDLIDWRRDADNLPWQPLNVGFLSIRGAEIHLDWYLPAMLGEQSALQRLHLGYTHIQANLGEGDGAPPLSRYVLENLRHQFIASLEYRILKKLYHTVAYRYTDRVSLDDYQLVDTRLQWRNKALGYFVEANNLFNSEYTETNLVPMPGRWVRLGINVRMGL
jgi:vitamin B12 transporter